MKNFKDDKTKIYWTKQYTRIMNPNKRQDILNYIRSNITAESHIIHFHTVREKIYLFPDKIACEHVWVKPIKGVVAGNNERNNGEFLVVEGPKIEGKLKGRIINKYINDGFYNINPPRACAKPVFLFNEMFRHLKPEIIIDPFAGYGSSIQAGFKLGMDVYACDLDDTLKWNFVKNNKYSKKI